MGYLKYETFNYQSEKCVQIIMRSTFVFPKNTQLTKN